MKIRVYLLYYLRRNLAEPKLPYSNIHLQESINKRGKLVNGARAVMIPICAIFSNRMQFNFRLTLLPCVMI